MSENKLQSFLQLFILCFLLSSCAACQIGTSPKAAPDNKKQTANDSNQNKTNQSENKQTEKTANATDSSAAVITKKDVAQKGTRIEDFSPKNWYLMMKAEGDLNGDDLPDAVAAFSRAKLFDGTDESTHSSAQSEADVNTERVLIIALRAADGSLNLDELSRKMILCRTCGAQLDETLMEVSIKNKAIEIMQGALGTSSADYLHKIRKDAERGWVVFYGEGKYRQRSTSKVSSAKQKGTIAFVDFDITAEVEKLNLSVAQTKN